MHCCPCSWWVLSASVHSLGPFLPPLSKGRRLCCCVETCHSITMAIAASVNTNYACGWMRKPLGVVGVVVEGRGLGEVSDLLPCVWQTWSILKIITRGYGEKNPTRNAKLIDTDTFSWMSNVHMICVWMATNLRAKYLDELRGWIFNELCRIHASCRCQLWKK